MRIAAEMFTFSALFFNPIGMNAKRAKEKTGRLKGMFTRGLAAVSGIDFPWEEEMSRICMRGMQFVRQKSNGLSNVEADLESPDPRVSQNDTNGGAISIPRRGWERISPWRKERSSTDSRGM